MKNILGCLFLLLSCFTQIIVAQTGNFYSTDNGLSSSLINQVYQDKRGFIWVATEYGLNRFDGLHFSTYLSSSEDSTSLKNNYVRTLFEDSKNHLFIGCISGLLLYERSTDAFREIPVWRNGQRVYPHVTQILELHNGELWFVTSGQGVFRIRKDLSGADSLDRVMDKISYLYFNSIYEDIHGNVWMGTEQYGLVCYRLATETAKVYRYPDINDDWISAIHEDALGELFIGTARKGVMCYDRAKDSFISVPYEKGGFLSVYSMELVNGMLLIGTDGTGLKAYNPARKIVEDHFINTTPIDFSTGKIHSIMQDKEKNLWLGLFQKGVVLIAAEQNLFEYYGERSVYYNPIGKGCVMALYTDDERNLWVGTDNEGLYKLDMNGRRIHHYQPDETSWGVPSVVTCLFCDSDKNLWLGSYMRGVAKFNPITGHCTYPLQDIENKKIYALAEDKHKNLYIGTMGAGFYKYNLQTSELTHYESSKDESGDLQRDELINDWINSIYCDSKGLVWLGHYKGVSCFDPSTDSFLHYNGRNVLITDCVGYVVREDSFGDIWAGTTEGLYRIERQTGKVHRFTTREGLPNNVICGLIEDNQKAIWVSTYKGISRFDRNSNRFINYYAGDGLQGNEFAHGAFCKDKNGKIYFGGVNGITAFQPEIIGRVNKKTNVWITNFFIFDRPINKNTLSGGKPVVTDIVQDADRFNLAYQDNTFSIVFSTLLFHNPEQIAYQYQMEELNRQWLTLEPGMNRVTYNNLQPGEYIFRVRAINHGNYSETRTVKICIASPWYQTWWAYTIYAMLLCLLILGVVSYIMVRIRHRREMIEHEHIEQLNEAKLQFFINISHEIRTPMTLIINPLEKLMAENKDSGLRQAYVMIYRNAQRILRLINQLMDIRKLDKGLMKMRLRETDIVGFINDLMQTFDYTAKKKHINFTFEHDKLPQLNAWIDLDNFDKVLVNIISNAFKYTPDGGEVKVTLTTGVDEQRRDSLRNYFQIEVIDSGIGIDSDKIERIFERFYQIENDVTKSNFGTGVGLHLSRSLVQLHHGVIYAENRLDTSGSRFIIRLPLGADHLRADELDLSAVSDETTAPASVRAMNHKIDVQPSENEEEKEISSLPDRPKTVKPHSNQRVLVVEDEAEVRDYLREILADEYRVDTCTNGREAYESILRNSPDIVISDVMMPEMDGMELCRKIRQNTNVNHIPIILLTAKSRPEDTLEGMGCGADAYIVKPFSTDILMSSIANLLANRRLLRNKFGGIQQQEDKMEKLSLKSSDEQLMDRIMKVVNRHLNDPAFSVEMLATEVGLSRVHVHRKLKELTNLSTRDFIKNIRLQQAAKLLKEDKKLSVSEIAYATGFTNLSHFSSSFREKYGMSPTEYGDEHLL